MCVCFSLSLSLSLSLSQLLHDCGRILGLSTADQEIIPRVFAVSFVLSGHLFLLCIIIKVIWWHRKRAEDEMDHILRRKFNLAELLTARVLSLSLSLSLLYICLSIFLSVYFSVSVSLPTLSLLIALLAFLFRSLCLSVCRPLLSFFVHQSFLIGIGRRGKRGNSPNCPARIDWRLPQITQFARSTSHCRCWRRIYYFVVHFEAACEREREQRRTRANARRSRFVAIARSDPHRRCESAEFRSGRGEYDCFVSRHQFQ